MSYKLAFVLAILPALALGASITSINGVVGGAQDCGGTGTFFNIDLEGCDQTPCSIANGTNLVIGMTFSPATTVTALKWMPYVYDHLGGVIRLAEITINTNLVPGSAYRIFDTINVPNRYHGVRGDLSVLLVNEGTGDRIACGIFEVLVV